MSSAANTHILAVEELEQFVDRIVQAAHPLAVIAFGSRARGDHRSDSDLDVAVIVEDEEATRRQQINGVTRGLRVSVDLLTMSKERYDRFRPWINTVQQQIDREGIRLYERGGQPANRSAFERLC